MSATILPAPLPFASDVEAVPPGEEQDITQVVAAIQTILANRPAGGGLQSDVHVKTHGCAVGEFEVLPGLPEELAQGLFHDARAYQAVVRFSNGAGQENSDWAPDARGLAIKVLGVEGKKALDDEVDAGTQDFVMINHPVFVAATAHDYLRVEQVLATAGDDKLATLTGVLTGGHRNPLQWHWGELVTAIKLTGHLPAHPASNRYYSMTPFRFGKYVVKFRVEPSGDPHDSFLHVLSKLGQSADGLRELLEETVRKQEVRFDFQVQLRTSAQTMPIEDARTEWPESESPYRTVATLRIPPQEIAKEEWKAACKNLSFTVWHALEEHRPLGGINRLRAKAYRASSEWRHQLAGVPRQEPRTLEEIFPEPPWNG